MGETSKLALFSTNKGAGGSSPAEWLDAERDRLFLWTPCLAALGIALYFALPDKPPAGWGLSGLALATVALWAVRRHGPSRLAGTVVFCLCLGFAASEIRAATVAAPTLDAPITARLEGRVLAAEWAETGALRTLIAPTRIGARTDRLPARVRISIRTTKDFAEPGQRIALLARLLPPPAPVEPGGFDFARQSWFQRIGATGWALSPPDILPAHASSLQGPSLEDRAAASIERLRSAIVHRIQHHLDGSKGAVAAALMTGKRRAIPEKHRLDLRDTGLAHILAISGLHMALFAGSLFWVVRAGAVFFPRLVLHYPIKKWAAGVALLGAAAYLVLSGSSIATQRAFIMIALMFVAILLDRPALTMRNVAIAALIVLLWTPESLLSVSFQMSFAAVVALIAVYESQQTRLISAHGQMESRHGGVGGSARRWLILVATYLAGLAITSLIAGTATAPFAAFHFNRYAAYGLAANLAAMPLIGFVVMPCALAAFLLMPFGLEGLALVPMGWGIDGVLWIADAIAHWPGAVHMVAAAPLSALVLVTVGGLWICLWRTRWRWAGGLGLAFGLALWSGADRPDLLVERSGKTVGILNAEGARETISTTPAYTLTSWLRRDGDARTPKETRQQSTHVSCDSLGCVYREAGRPVVAYARTLGALREDCRAADIIVAPVPVSGDIRRSCRARLVIDRFDLWRNGAYAVFFDGAFDGAFNGDIVHARAARGNWPWAIDPRKPNPSGGDAVQ